MEQNEWNEIGEDSLLPEYEVKQKSKDLSDSDWGKMEWTEGEENSQKRSKNQKLIIDSENDESDNSNDRNPERASKEYDEIINEISEMVLPSSSMQDVQQKLDKDKLIGYFVGEEFNPGLMQRFFSILVNRESMNANEIFLNFDVIFQVLESMTVYEVQEQINKRYKIPYLNLYLKLTQAQLVNKSKEQQTDVYKTFDLFSRDVNLLLQSYISWKTICAIKRGYEPPGFVFGVIAHRTSSLQIEMNKNGLSSLAWDVLLSLASTTARKYVRDGVQSKDVAVCVPHYVDGVFTHYWKEWNTKNPSLRDWVAEVFAKDKLALHGFGGSGFADLLSRPGIIDSVASNVGVLNIPLFPNLKTKREWLAAPNGVFSTKFCKFYTWDQLRNNLDGIMPSEVICHNFINVPFPEELYEYNIENWEDISVPPISKIFESQRFHEKEGLIPWIWALFFGRNFYWANVVGGEKWQIMFGAVGQAGSGKSVCLEAIQMFFHPKDIGFVSETSQKTFVGATLLDKFIVMATDIGSDFLNGKFSGMSMTDLFRLVCNETGNNQEKHKQQVKTDPFGGTFVFGANNNFNLGKNSNDSDTFEAFLRRCIILLFLWEVPKSKIDTKLSEQLKTKYIWHFFLKSCLAYHHFAGLYGNQSLFSENVPFPEFLKQATDDIRKQGNPLYGFLKNAKSEFLLCPQREKLRGKPHEEYYCRVEYFINFLKDWAKRNGYPNADKLEWKASLWNTPFQKFGLKILDQDVTKPDPNQNNINIRSKWIIGLKIKTEEDKNFEKVADILSNCFEPSASVNDVIQLKELSDRIEKELLSNYQIKDQNIRTEISNSMEIIKTCLIDLGYPNNLSQIPPALKPIFDQYKDKIVILNIKQKK